MLRGALLCLALVCACSASEREAESAGGGTSGSGSSGGSVATGGSWASGGSGGAALPCDAGFAFQPDPPQSGSVLQAKFSHAQPLTFIDLKVSGPTQPSVKGTGISTSNPWTWDFEVVGLSAGVYTFEFWAGEPNAKIASCQRAVVDTGPAPDAGSGGSGGSTGGSGGGGGHCCHLVGTKLANPSPCGPSQSASPWQTLDNAGCNAAGCQKIWCPFEKCDSAKYPGGCPQGTEACWIDDSFASYEDACKSCCQSYGACWDSAIGTCRHPGDCGSPLWKCPWQG